MDLASLDTGADAAVLHLRHPATDVPIMTDDDPPQPVTITLYGADSEIYRLAQRAIVNARLNRKKASQVSAEDIENNATDVLAKCVAEWKNIKLDGKKLDCTPANAKLLFERLTWVREQCDEFINERANFVKASAKT